MKTLLKLALIIGLTVVPGLALATYNETTLTGDTTVLSINGITVNLTGGGAVVATTTVDSTSFDVTMESGSTLSITAPDLNRLSYSALSLVTAPDIRCDGTISTLTLLGPATGTETVTITPSATLCSTGSGGGSPVSSGGGGGGGGGSSTVTVTPAAPVVVATTTPKTTAATTTKTTVTTPATTAPVQTATAAPATPVGGLTVAQVDSILGLLKSFAADQTVIDNVRASLYGKPTQPSANAKVPAAASHGMFMRSLQLGMSHDDVKALQVYLNTHGFKVSASGAGSLGNETARFGAATKAALAKFQKSAGISPASGFFGSMTRKYVNEHP